MAWYTRTKIQKTGEYSHDVVWNPEFPLELRALLPLHPYEMVAGEPTPRTWAEIREAVNALSVGETQTYWCVVLTDEPAPPAGDVPGAIWDDRDVPPWSEPVVPPPLPSQEFRDAESAACDAVVALTADPNWPIAIAYIQHAERDELMTKALWLKTIDARNALNELLESTR